MGALPRPATPGPWWVETDDMDGPVLRSQRTGENVAFVIDTRDALAFAATHERIAREDRVREFCDRLIASADAHPDDDHCYSEGAVARTILRILDGEEGA